MLVIAHHNVNDPETFWSKAQTISSVTPAGLKLPSVDPSTDGKTGTCVWEAGTVEEVQKFLDEQTAEISTNFCYEVNEATAFGVPETKKAAALN